jgi:hypothetical protein
MKRRRLLWFLSMCLVAASLGLLTTRLVGPWWASFPACLALGLLLGDVSQHLAARKKPS